MKEKIESINWQLFEKIAAEAISSRLNTKLYHNKMLSIGDHPGWNHKFDFSNEDYSVVIECKANKWNSVPAAKISTLNEVLFFFSFLPSPPKTRKILAMWKAPRNERSGPNTFAKYYYDHYHFLFRDVELWEIDSNGNIEILTTTSPCKPQ